MSDEVAGGVAGGGAGVDKWVAEREETGEVAAQAHARRAWRQRGPLRLVAGEEGEVLGGGS